MHPQASIRLELPRGNGELGAIDIVVTIEGRHHGIELKYLSRRFECKVHGEHFSLKQQGAQLLRRYDVCKDIHRMEKFTISGHTSSVLVLTNDSAFWNGAKRDGFCDTAFRIGDGEILRGTAAWASHTGQGTRKGRNDELTINGEYLLSWHDYSQVEGANGRFRYLLIDAVGPMIDPAR